MFYEVVPKGKVEVLTYDFDGSLLPGQIVMVPLGKRLVPGVVMKKVVQPDFKTKTIAKVLYSKPLPEHLLKTIQFISDYYLTAAGQVVSMILPNGVEKKRRKTEQMFGFKEGFEDSDSDCVRPARRHGRAPLNLALPRSGGPSSELRQPSTKMSIVPLNSHQKKALIGLQEGLEATKLLFGVTGSGKTNIYLKMALDALKQQKSTILLVPEIALTSQLVQIFQEFFGGRVVVLHSKQTEAERHLIFNSLLGATEPMIVIGPRSALFSPLSNLGLIIIDEEHEPTYYQENAPRYSAIRVASFMAKTSGFNLILGSATPTVADYYIAKQKNSLTELSVKAKDSATRPEVSIVDFKNRDNFSKNRYFSDKLLASIRDNLENGRQTLIFHNRRGSSPLTICENCGEEMLCPICYLPLTLHVDNYKLKCHTCGFEKNVPKTCPKCNHPDLIHKGFGTKLLEEELKRLFPKAKVARFDADNKKGEGLEDVYEMVKNGKVDILVGTQGLAKGLDLPKLATVGVVAADTGLSLPDFAAEERVFQLLTQVMGRVGRGHIEKAEVIIQTYRPDHPVLKFAIEEDFIGFADYALKLRHKGGFPPYKYLAKVDITLKTEAGALRKIREAATRLVSSKKLIVSPPMPAFHERTNKGYTWEITVRATSRKVLIQELSQLDKNFRVILDPPSLL